MEYRVDYNIDAKDYVKLRVENKWNEIKEDQVREALKYSMINISVFDGNRCVGMGRIVGDGILKGMLTDVIVSIDYHGKGIGKLIVTSLINKLIDIIPKEYSFQLESSPTKGNRDFYIKCGFKYKPENQDGVYIWINK